MNDELFSDKHHQMQDVHFQSVHQSNGSTINIYTSKVNYVVKIFHQLFTVFMTEITLFFKLPLFENV